jgi:hypothetical protein
MESAFVHSLIDKTQALHEQETIAKSNELRRVRVDILPVKATLILSTPPQRENTINDLHSKIAMLESEVARLLRTKVKPRLRFVRA